MLKNFDTIDLGLVDYNKAFLFQKDFVEKRQKDLIKDTIIFCSHPSVVTLGRSSKPEDLAGWKGDIIETNRGGRATYHGPGQIIIYPIIKIKNNPNIDFRNQDVRAYLEFLENLVIQVLAEVGLKASAVSSTPLEPGQLNRGVWVNNYKVASIGIAVKKWVTMHGVALNLQEDPLAFNGIFACGFNSDRYSSLQNLGLNLSYNEMVNIFINKIKN